MAREPQVFEEKEDKLRHLILYIAQKCAGHMNFGTTKLNKILYFSDFLAYARSGEPITGCEYQRLDHGPAPRSMKPVIEEMKDESQLTIQTLPSFPTEGYTTNRPVNLILADLDKHFIPSEISIVDEVINLVKDWSAAKLSDVSHDWGGWKFARKGETIPYESVFIDNSPLTESDVDAGLKVAKHHGLLAG